MGFVTFWRKDIGKKRAHKMMVKLTPGSGIRQKVCRLLNVVLTFFCDERLKVQSSLSGKLLGKVGEPQREISSFPTFMLSDSSFVK